MAAGSVEPPDLDFASTLIASQSPRISASFLALDHPLICCSKAIAPSRVSNSPVHARSTGLRIDVWPIEPSECWRIRASISSVCPT